MKRSNVRTNIGSAKPPQVFRAGSLAKEGSFLSLSVSGVAFVGGRKDNKKKMVAQIATNT
jgi:hypothetical protein